MARQLPAEKFTSANGKRRDSRKLARRLSALGVFRCLAGDVLFREAESTIGRWGGRASGMS